MNAGLPEAAPDSARGCGPASLADAATQSSGNDVSIEGERSPGDRSSCRAFSVRRRPRRLILNHKTQGRKPVVGPQLHGSGRGSATPGAGRRGRVKEAASQCRFSVDERGNHPQRRSRASWRRGDPRRRQDGALQPPRVGQRLLGPQGAVFGQGASGPQPQDSSGLRLQERWTQRPPTLPPTLHIVSHRQICSQTFRINFLSVPLGQTNNTPWEARSRMLPRKNLNS